MEIANPMFILQTSRLQMSVKPLRSPQFLEAALSAKALEPLVYVKRPLHKTL